MARPRLVVATRSEHKLRELRELLRLEHADLVSLDELGVEGEPVEDGETFETNAAIKARFAVRATGLPSLADDSGLEVDALGGGPGVRTRRYAGEDATDADNNAKLLRELAGLPPDRRGARYVCVLALALPGDVGARGGQRGHVRARHVPRADRHRAARDRRVRLRPDLRARVRAAGRSDAGVVEPGREARDLAPRPGGPPDDAAPRRARVLRRPAWRPSDASACSAARARAATPATWPRRAPSGRPWPGAGIGLVYGGGRVGLMGAVADATLAAGGEVIGVIPQGLVDRELAHPGPDGAARSSPRSTSARPSWPSSSDAFLALPGGLGTLEELAEVTSWAQLELHTKPIGLLDVGGYWDPLLAWLDRAVEEGFVAPAHRHLLAQLSRPRDAPRRVCSLGTTSGSVERERVRARFHAGSAGPVAGRSPATLAAALRRRSLCRGPPGATRWPPLAVGSPHGRHGPSGLPA